MDNVMQKWIQEEVEKYCKKKSLKFGDFQSFQYLVDYMKKAIPTAFHSIPKSIPEDELRMVIAMCWLGPDPIRYGSLPAFMCENLLSFLQKEIPDKAKRLEHIMEFVIAYGCGRFRTLDKASQGWDGSWPNAVIALAATLVLPPLRDCNQWLERNVVGFPQPRNSQPLQPQDDALTNVNTLALILIDPEQAKYIQDHQQIKLICTPGGTKIKIPKQSQHCTDYDILPGAKFVCTIQNPTQNPTQLWLSDRSISIAPGTKLIVSAHDEVTWITIGNSRFTLKLREEASLEGPFSILIWACSCGHIHCQDRHRIVGWKPNDNGKKITLRSFVSSAIKGPTLELKTNSFVQGMYFAFLCKGQELSDCVVRIRLAPVEYKVCVCKQEYEGDTCTANSCHRRFQAAEMKKILLDLIILDGRYNRVQRLRCPKCENLYDVQIEKEDIACPSCKKNLLKQYCSKCNELYRLESKAFRCPSCGSTWLPEDRAVLNFVKKRMMQCPFCRASLAPQTVGCPSCKKLDTLPQRFIYVWIRNFSSPSKIFRKPLEDEEEQKGTAMQKTIEHATVQEDTVGRDENY